MKLRSALEYSNLSEKFKEKPDFGKQYCNIYLTRLKQMTPLLEEQIEQKWGKTYPICKLYKISEENYPKCIVMGTLFKDQKLKPSILKQIAGGNNLLPQPLATHFTDKSDVLYIEDELQRYQIIGTLDCDYLVTGISVALLGSADDKGRFIAEDFVFSGYRPQIQRPLFDDSIYIVMISGLDLVNSQNYAINLQLFQYWIYGLIGDLNGISTSKISRIIIAGNSIRKIPIQKEPSISLLSKTTESIESIEAVKVLDKFLSELVKVIDVDLLPGEFDPANHLLPQESMHFCMFPNSGPYKSLNRVSNPYYCSLSGVKLLGNSGQPVNDVMRYSEIADPLEVLEKCLEWGHMAPTAPDTLGCFPFYEKDPFIIDECPHVFFTGNQARFDSKECIGRDGQKVRLVAVPEFSSTFEAVVLDLKSLECRNICFKTLL